MRLSSVQISNYRSILESGNFSIGAVTCLVGKNESGKTAILQALHKLKPYEQAEQSYDKVLDYPRRHVNNYKGLHSEGEAVVVDSSWHLDDADVNAIEEVVGKGVIKTKDVRVTKTYEDKTPSIACVLDYKLAIKHLLHNVVLSTEEQSVADRAETTKVLRDAFAKLPAASEGAKAVLDRIRKYKHATVFGEVGQIVFDRMPSFLYFDNYDRMSGTVSLQKLMVDQAQNTITANDRVFNAFLEFAGTSAKELANLNTFEPLKSRVEGASNAITEQIFEYWSQNQFLQVQFVGELGLPNDPPPFNSGLVMRARIYNELHKATVRFDDRSAGFIWFFSFLVLFSQVKKSHGNVIILLDEPGLNLHGKAQADLLRYFQEKLRPDHQLIYTTHSPFMVPPNDLLSVRTVEDVIEFRDRGKAVSHGTKVGDSVLSTDSDTLFPLQGALGYEITQSLFIGANTLLVEGPGDVLMLQAVSEELRKRKRGALDPLWAICPVGGIAKISAFVSLFGANKLNVAVFTDYSKSDDQQIERARSLLAVGKVFTAEAFCGQVEADIEDLFGPAIYAAMINGAYKLSARYKVASNRLEKAKDDPERITKRVATAWSTLPASTPGFDHFAPASWLIQHPEVWEVDEAEAEAVFARFEALFAVINETLVRV